MIEQKMEEFWEKWQGVFGWCGYEKEEVLADLNALIEEAKKEQVKIDAEIAAENGDLDTAQEIQDPHPDRQAGARRLEIHNHRRCGQEELWNVFVSCSR